MYIPPAFRDDDRASLHDAIRSVRLASLVTASSDGLMASPLPMFLEDQEGEWGTLYAHVARANPQWQRQPVGDAMAIFMGDDAYITPSWYATKRETGKVVPTWNYVAVHAYGTVEFFDDRDRLHDIVDRLTNLHETKRAAPWAVSDAPADYMAAQLKGIVGVRLAITRLEGKRKMSQNRPAADRAGVIAGLSESASPNDQDVARLIPKA